MWRGRLPRLKDCDMTSMRAPFERDIGRVRMAGVPFLCKEVHENKRVICRQFVM